MPARKRNVGIILAHMAAGLVAGVLAGGGVGLSMALFLFDPFVARAAAAGGVLGMVLAGIAARNATTGPWRIIGITLALMATGLVFGGAAGAVMMYAWRPNDLLEGALFGGTVGMVLGPFVAWMLMRHVPLWLAVGGTTLGTVAGWMIGLRVGYFSDAHAYALYGFLASALLLRFATPRTRHRRLPA
jgi:hypothetical protein